MPVWPATCLAKLPPGGPPQTLQYHTFTRNTGKQKIKYCELAGLIYFFTCITFFSIVCQAISLFSATWIVIFISYFSYHIFIVIVYFSCIRILTYISIFYLQNIIVVYLQNHLSKTISKDRLASYSVLSWSICPWNVPQLLGIVAKVV